MFLIIIDHYQLWDFFFYFIFFLHSYVHLCVFMHTLFLKVFCTNCHIFSFDIFFIVVQIWKVFQRIDEREISGGIFFKSHSSHLLFHTKTSFKVKKKVIFLLLTLSSKVEKCLCIRFVCLSFHALTLVNILQTSWNLNMLFISDKAWTVLKMVYIRQMVCLQRHTSLPIHYGLWGEKI